MIQAGIIGAPFVWRDTTIPAIAFILSPLFAKTALTASGISTTKKMILNAAGKLLETEWLALPQRFPTAILHEYQIMPNHFHCILEIKNVFRDGQAVDPKSLGDIIGALQSIVTVEYIKGVKNENWPPFRKRLFQCNYYETIIRSREAYDAITRYIIKYPEKPYR